MAQRPCAKCGEPAEYRVYYRAHDDVSEAQCRKHAFSHTECTPIVRQRVWNWEGG